MQKRVRTTRKVQDASTRKIFEALKSAFPELPDDSKRVVYRYNPVAIRVRVMDRRFEGMSLAGRLGLVRGALKSLPPSVLDDITMILTLTPDEANEPHLLSEEFDDPTGSRL